MNKKKSVKSESQEKKGERFLSFIFQKKQQLDWIIMGAICLAGYIVLKYCYPYPAVTRDSGSYVLAAVKDTFDFYRPFGYPYFLQIIHSISSSIHAVFIFQMLLYFISTFVFAFTIKYFFPPNKKMVWYLLLVFLSLSPSAFYLANSIMSESIFTVSIYLMLSGLLFVIMRQSWIGLVLFSIALFCTLSIRYSAIIFPFVFIPFLLFSKGFIRWITIACSVLVFFVFYAQTKKNMKEVTGFNQFSTGFDGWQLANNALHIFPYIDLKPESIKDEDLRNFHQFLLPYKDKILNAIENGQRRVTTDFLWGTDQPLKQFLFKSIEEQYSYYFAMWIKLGSGLYADYGRYLILHYPFKFMRYYYLPNAVNMLYPTHTGNLSRYIGMDGATDIINWYKVSKDEDLSCKNDIYGSFLTKCISISSIFIWISIAIIGAIGITYRKKIKFTKEETIVFWLLITFGMLYYTSIIFMSLVELRYWLPMACIQFSFFYILLNKFSEDKIFTLLFHKQKQENK